jgi:hypothetical protein
MASKRMGRPPKSKAERKSVDLRIPVTPEQKELVGSAARAEGMDMAEWARPILFHAARKALAAQPDP